MNEPIEDQLIAHLADRADEATLSFGVDDVVAAAGRPRSGRPGGSHRWWYNAVAAAVLVGGIGSGLFALGRDPGGGGPSSDPDGSVEAAASETAASDTTVSETTASEGNETTTRLVDERIEALRSDDHLQSLDLADSSSPATPWLNGPIVVLDAAGLGRVQVGTPSSALVDRWPIEPTEDTRCAVADHAIVCTSVLDAVVGGPTSWAAALAGDVILAVQGPLEAAVATTPVSERGEVLIVGLPADVALIEATNGAGTTFGQIPIDGTVALSLPGWWPSGDLRGLNAGGTVVWAMPGADGEDDEEPPAIHDPQVFDDLGYGGLIPAPVDLGPEWTGFAYRSAAGINLPALPPGGCADPTTRFLTATEGLVATYDNVRPGADPLGVVAIREIEGGLAEAFAGFRARLACEEAIDERPLPDLPGSIDAIRFDDAGYPAVMVLRDDLLLLISIPAADDDDPVDIDIGALAGELLAAHDR